MRHVSIYPNGQKRVLLVQTGTLGLALKSMADTTANAARAEEAAVSAQASADAADTARDDAVAATTSKADRNGGNITSPSAWREALELGDAAQKATGTVAGTLAAGDDVRIVDALRNGLPRVYIAGDSRGDQASDPGRTAARGWIWPLQILTEGRFDFQDAYNFAIGGDDTQDMLDKVGQLLAVEPGIVIVICSTNDRTGTDTADESIGRMLDWQNQVLAHGHRVIWIAETPRGSASDTTYRLNATRYGYHMRVRRWQLAQATKPSVYVVDPWPQLGALNSNLSDVKSGYFYDDLHFGPPAARVIADLIAPVLTTLIPPAPRLVEALGDLWSAQNPTGSLNANPVLAGTGGTAGTGATGTVATSWTVTAGAGLSVTCSKIVTDDTLYHGQSLVVTGAPTAENSGATPVDPTPFSAIASVPLANIDVGDILEGSAWIRLHSGSSGVRGVALYLTVTTASGTTTYCAGEPHPARSFPNLELPDSELVGTWIIPAAEITEAVISATLSVVITGAPHTGSASDVSISATVDFTRASVRKVLD